MVDFTSDSRLNNARSRSCEGLESLEAAEDVYSQYLLPSNAATSGSVKSASHEDDDLSSDSELSSHVVGHDMSSISRIPSQISLPTPPDGGWGWIIVVASFFIHVVGDGIMISFGVLFMELTDAFPNDSKSVISLIGAFSYCIPAIFAPLASALINSFGCRFVCMLGGFISGFGCFLSYFVNSVISLIFTFGFINGLGQSMCLTSALVIVANYFRDRRAFAMGLSISGMGIGTFLFAPILSFLISYYTWRGTMLILSGLYLNLMVFGALLRPIEDKLANRKRRLLAHIENFSRQSGLDITKKEDYRASDVDRKIELLKEALTTPDEIYPVCLRFSEQILDKEIDFTESQNDENAIINKETTLFKRLSPHGSRHSSTEQDDIDEDLKNLRQNFANISYVRDFMPFPESYRIFIAEPTLATITEDEVLEIPLPESAIVAETGSILGHSSHDIFGACIDLSNPLSDEDMSSMRSIRSLSRSGDLDRSVISLKKLSEERNWKSLGDIFLAKDSDEPWNDPTLSTEGPIRVQSDPDLERFHLLVPKHLDDILYAPLLPRRPSRIPTPCLHSEHPECLEKEEVKNARVLWKKRHSLHVDMATSSQENALAAVVIEERAVQHYRKSRSPEQSPFKRSDIFYRGSLNRMCRLESAFSMSMPMFKFSRYRPSSYCDPCSKSGNQLLRNMLDFSILQHCNYTLFLISNSILLMWSMMSLFYLGHWAIACGITENKAALLFSILGITNAIGHGFVGWFADQENTNTLILYIVLIGISGAATSALPILQDFVFLTVYAGIFGFSIAASDSLCSVLVVELLGVQRLTNGIGVILCGQGIAVMLGPPILGLIVDLPNGYQLGFFISGLLIVFSATLLLPILFNQRCSSHRTGSSGGVGGTGSTNYPFHSSKTVITSLPINGDHLGASPALV